jgi:hypothetical protein
MPPLGHWFSNAAAGVAAPTALTAALGLWSVWPADPGLSFWGYAAVVAAVVLLVWWRSAQQDFESSRAIQQISELLERLALSKASAPAPPIAIEDLKTLTADQIRDRVAIMAEKMRVMDHSFHQARNHTLFADREKSVAITHRLLAQSQEHRRLWNMELRPEAAALWGEMNRRIHGAPPYPEDMNAIALEHGSLSGPSPLTDSAQALERLSREMPG